MELVFAIIFLGIISMTSSKLLLHLKKQETLAEQNTTLELSLYNVLLQIDHLLDLFEFRLQDQKLLLQDGAIWIKDGHLYFNDALLLEDLEAFEMQDVMGHLLLRVCKQTYCLQKIKLVY